MSFYLKTPSVMYLKLCTFLNTLVVVSVLCFVNVVSVLKEDNTETSIEEGGNW